MKYEQDIYPAEIEFTPEQTRTVGVSRIENGSVMVDGNNSRLTVVYAPGNANYNLDYDSRFVEKGIVTEPESLLIDQNATADLLGKRAGERPEEYASSASDETVVLPGNHFGWQTGAILIQNGQFETIANDRESLTYPFDVLVNDSGQWQLVHLDVVNGQVSQEDQSKIYHISVGMSGPAIVKGGQITDLKEILDDPRIVADPRNIVDYAAGNKVPGNFFQDIRKVTPDDHALERMVREQPSSVVMRAPIPENKESQEPFNRLNVTIQENNLDHMKMDTKNGDYRLGIFGKLPEQHMPLMSYGHDKDGNLIAVAVDGRQPGSVGVSITELARIMKVKGAVNAILGCGGGDVSVVAKTEEGFEILNSPANVDQDGNRVTRNVPNVLTINPQ